MASSQVENFSSSPFGCVLRDHNGREYRYRKKNNAHVCIQHNLKDLVQSCFSASPENAADSIMAGSLEKKDDKWAKAREIVFEKEPSRAVSSLVQKWRVFEAESKNLNLNNNNHINSSSCSSRSNSGSTFTENSQFLDGHIRNPNVTESVGGKSEAPSMTEESFLDSESDRMGPNRDFNSTEKEKLRVSDIIKKLKCVNGEECNEQFAANVALSKVRTSFDQFAPEKRGFASVPASPRIRGRKAFSDLFMQIERDRHQEVQRLGECKAVSKFSHRGRLQAMLKVKIILHAKEEKEGEQINSLVSNRRMNSKGSSVMHLRERFNTGLEQNAVSSSPCREVINSTQDVDKSSASTQLKEVADHTPNMKDPSTSDQLKEVVDHTPNKVYPSTSTQLKEVVDHTRNAGNPTTSTQHQEEIHSPEVTHPESPRKMVVDVNSNVVTSSTCNDREDDVNQNTSVVCPTTSKSLKDIIHSWEQTHLRSLRKNQDVANETLQVEAWSTSDRVKIDISRHDVMTPQQNALELQIEETPYKEASPNLDVLLQVTAFDTRSFKSQESVDNATSPDEWKDKNEAEEVNNEQSIASLHELVEDNPLLKIDWEEQLDREKAEETFPDWKSNFSQAPSEWEEDQSYQQIDESLDWIYDVSRPRSDWEYLRQERYQEMLDPFRENGDIKQLLERKSVSSFLSCGLRDTIDQLMISRTQGQPIITGNQVEQVNQEEVVREEEKYEREENKHEGGVECYPEGEEEDESLVGRQQCEADEYSDQTPSMISASPYMFGPWAHNQDNHVSDDYVASPSLQQYRSFNSHTLENQQFSSLRSNHPSIEMELISDLRGHMEQLHKEIFDLRKSLHTCMEMQVKLQHSMMREAESVKSHSAQNKGTGSIDRIPRKGTCRLCFDADVDSLLYRCGHMCTCYKCAHELQQRSGKCPICQAPILDVVRTYTDDR